MNTLFLIPIRNDYESAALLISEFESNLRNYPQISPFFVLVDDGSDEIQQDRIQTKLEYQILELGFKAGHQSAIFQGLNFVESNFKNINIVVLDGDGEDRPEDSLIIAQKLLLNQNGASIIAARRLSRENSILSLAINSFFIKY
jgi:hypothetical protein